MQCLWNCVSPRSYVLYYIFIQSTFLLFILSKEGELSEEMFEFHEVISHMQEEEEAVIDEHREIVEVPQQSLTNIF